LNTISALSCGLLASGVGIGYWIYGFTNICYHLFYPPFVYVTFLADFFQEEDLHLKDVYYSKLKDFMGNLKVTNNYTIQGIHKPDVLLNDPIVQPL